MSEEFDVVVIGAGPGGYVAAIRCAQLGLKTACVDRTRVGDEASPGGTCLNVGCIPSKALLDSSEKYQEALHGLAAHGIGISGVDLDLSRLMARKQEIVDELTGGVRLLLKSNGVAFYNGHGTLRGDRGVAVAAADGGEATEIRAAHVILASGSEPAPLPVAAFDGEIIVDSTGALSFDAMPERLGVVGAGVIGLELGSVWRRLGSEVVMLEAMEEFLGAADEHVSREALRQFRRQGLDIRFGAQVISAGTANGVCTVTYERGGERESIEVDKLIVAIGRRPLTEDLFDAETGIGLDERGFIEVDAQNRTAMDGVYAIGDAVRGPMLAHKASEEGVAVAERIAGGHGHVDFNTIPWVIYTHPEIAWVGKTERELKRAGTAVKSGTFAFAATGRAKAMNDTAGFVKIVADSATDRILGVHVVGPHASELIAEAVLAMEYRASSEDLARTVHAHPTLSEAVHEAALAVDGRAIHKTN